MMRYLILKENEPPIYTDKFLDEEFPKGSKMAFFDLYFQLFTLDGEKWEEIKTENPEKD